MLSFNRDQHLFLFRCASPLSDARTCPPQAGTFIFLARRADVTQREVQAVVEQVAPCDVTMSDFEMVPHTGVNIPFNFVHSTLSQFLTS